MKSEERKGVNGMRKTEVRGEEELMMRSMKGRRGIGEECGEGEKKMTRRGT